MDTLLGSATSQPMNDEVPKQFSQFSAKIPADAAGIEHRQTRTTLSSLLLHFDAGFDQFFTYIFTI